MTEVVYEGLLRKSRSINGTGWSHISLTECPACGHTFDNEKAWEVASHLDKEHLPEDFGLSPLRGGDPDHREIRP